MKHFYILSTLFLALPLITFSQCDVGEVEVTIDVITDNWGYEAYWQLQPQGVNCGNDNLFEGGNENQVGCNGAGDEDATPGNGYGNN
ncbi:MAG: hypothetical protein ACPGED_09850, partial [Flavobacteriales bacterium]